MQRRAIELGSLTSLVRSQARWVGQDDWPSTQEWADEVERVLRHLEAHGQFSRYLPRLRGDNRQRNSTMAEARIAYWFTRNGFIVQAWEPAATSRPGDLEVRWAGLPPIFVEIKQPSWEGELSAAELSAGRKLLPRYLHAEARWHDPVSVVKGAVRKSLGKFSPDRPNLVIVAENTFVSPVDSVDADDMTEWLSTTAFEPVGGVLLFDAVLRSSEVEYRTVFSSNRLAFGRPWEIPVPIAEGLRAGNFR